MASGMNFASDTQLKKICGTTNRQEQVARLQERGLNPFIDPTDGKPIIFIEVIAQSMLGSHGEGFEPDFQFNESVFDDD